MGFFLPVYIKRIIFLAIVFISQNQVFSQTFSFSTLDNQSNLITNSANLSPETLDRTTNIENRTIAIVALSTGSDARLSALKISSGTLTPTFASGTTSYTSSVSTATSSLTVTPTTMDANATVKVNGTALISGSASSAINLSFGGNTITIVVTAQDGTTTQTYTVTVTRQFPPPTILITGSLHPFTSCSGNVSNIQSITVSGTNLFSDIIINVPFGFEISLSSSANYQTNLSLPLSNNNVSATTIYVRLANSANGSITGNLSFGSVNANSQNVALSGSVNPLPATPTVTAGTSTTFCQGGSVILTSSASLGNKWFLNALAINGAAATTYTANASGDYTVQFTNVNGCVSAGSLPKTIIVNPIPASLTISPVGATTFCTGGSVLLISNTASNYLWLRNGSVINSATSSTYTANISGDYTVRTYNNSGCVSLASAAVTVTVNPLPATPAISAGRTTTFCSGGSVVLTSNASSGNQWFLDGIAINGATTFTYKAAVSGNYTVQTTNSNGCASAVSAVIPVTVIPLPVTPTISVGSSTIFCLGGSVVLSSDSPSGNHWFRNGVAINGATASTYTANTSGDYSLQTTNINGCVSPVSPGTTVIANSIPPTPTISSGTTTTFCIGGSVVLTSSSPSGNQWLLNGAAISGATAATYKANISGDYRVQTTNNNGCVSAVSNAKTVTVYQLPVTPTISAGTPTTFCNGGSVVLTSSETSGNHWFRNGASITGASANTYKANTSGDYTVQTTNNNGCLSSSVVITVTVNPIPTTPAITAGSNTTFCNGGSVILTSSSTSGNQWFLNGAAITGATTTTYTATASGNYTVQTTSNGCVSAVSAAKTITVKPILAIPTITAGGTPTFCFGGSVVLTSSASSGNHWFFNSTAITGATAATYKANTSGNYTVQISNNNGCVSTSAAVTVTVNPLPDTPKISAGSTTTFCIGGSVVLSSSSVSYNKWYLNGLVINNDTTGTYTAAESGNYTVQTTNNNGCVSAMSIPTTISVIPNPAKPTFSWNGSIFTADSKSDQLQWELNGTPIPGENSFTFKPQSIGNITLRITNSFGCTAVSSIYNLNSIFTSTVSLKDNYVRLFPNPSPNEVWLEFSKELTSPIYVQLYTYSGVLLQTFSTTRQKNKILLDTYAQGHYYITFGSGTDKVTLPITKSNN